MHRGSLIFPLQFIFLTWLVLSIEHLFGVDFGILGILPLSGSGIIGLCVAPLIHGSVDHLLSNTLPLLILGGILFYFYPSIAKLVFLRCYFFTNILVWLFGRSFYHIGSSGIIYGIAFFLIFFGFFRRNLSSLIISVVVLFFYGGILYTVFPTDERVSYESHLFGTITGLVTAFMLSKYKRPTKVT